MFASPYAGLASTWDWIKVNSPTSWAGMSARPSLESQVSDWERGRHEPGVTMLVDRLEDVVEEIREEPARLKVLADWVRQVGGPPPGLSATSDRLSRLEQALHQLADEVGESGSTARH